MAVKRLVATVRAVEYTGDNAQEVIDALGPETVTGYDIVLVSESDGQAVFTVNQPGWGPSEQVLSIGDWVSVDSPGISLAAEGGLGKYAVFGE